MSIIKKMLEQPVGDIELPVSSDDVLYNADVLTGALNQIKNNIQTNTDSISNIDDGIEVINNSIEAIENNIDSINVSIANINTDIDTLENLTLRRKEEKRWTITSAPAIVNGSQIDLINYIALYGGNPTTNSTDFNFLDLPNLRANVVNLSKDFCFELVITGTFAGSGSAERSLDLTFGVIGGMQRIKSISRTTSISNTFTYDGRVFVDKDGLASTAGVSFKITPFGQNFTLTNVFFGISQ